MEQKLIANPVEQAIRISHCSNRGKEHACIGQCTITPAGIQLECKLCGTDKKERVNETSHAYRRACAILETAGVDFNRLNIQTQERVIREVQKDSCPNCNALHFREPYRDYFHCECGWICNGGKWKKAPEPILPVREVEVAAAPAMQYNDIPF